jgi:serine/threonine protein kinase
MNRLKLEHETLTQNSMGSPPELVGAAMSLQVPRNPTSEAIDRSAHSFELGQEPHLIKNWCGAGGSSIIGTGGVYTPVVPKIVQELTQNAPRGYADVPSGSETSVWVPMIPTQFQGETILVPNNPPSGGAFIGSRDGKSAYRVFRSIGGGTYGGVFLASRVNVHDMSDAPNGKMALKIMPIESSFFVEDPRPDHPKRLSPRAVNGALVQYIFQRSYGGCMPYSVCMHDAFMLAIPAHATSDAGSSSGASAGPSSGAGAMRWHAVIVMEAMDGNVMDLIRSEEILSMPPSRRYAVVLKLACKMARAVFDLELQRIFHDDIKPQNFLFRRLGVSGEYEIKVTDFDLGAFAGRSNVSTAKESIDNAKLASEIIKESTRGNLDRDSDLWKNVPGIRLLLRANADTTKFYKPPEYDLVKLITKGMLGSNVSAELSLSARMLDMPLPPMVAKTVSGVGDFAVFRSKNIFNADWLSRMMAFELISSIREMFLSAGLSPHYSVHRLYPVDIMVPQGKTVNRSATTLIRMAPDGDDNIVPPIPAWNDPSRMLVWSHLRSTTVHPSNLDSKQMDGLKSINTMIANVLAPRTPDAQNRAVHHAMRSISVSPGNIQTLCASQDNFVAVRPTTGDVLRTLLDAAVRGNIIPANNFHINSIPTSVQTSLSADLLMAQ